MNGILATCYLFQPDYNQITIALFDFIINYRYYLNQAASIPPRTPMETEYARKSKELVDRLDNYDLTQEGVFLDMPFEN